MTDRDGKYSAEDSGYTSHAGSVWSPSGITGGFDGSSALTLGLGLVAVVLTVVDRFPVVAWLLATIGVISGLRVFMPRVTTRDKVLIGLGVVASLVAIVVLLVRIANP